MAVCVAVLDRNSTPLALATSDPDRELDFHYIVHTSIDVINEKCAGSTAGSSGATSVGQPGAKLEGGVGAVANSAANRELYLGVLYSTEQHKVFGYVTNTKIKFIVIVGSSAVLRDNEGRSNSWISCT